MPGPLRSALFLPAANARAIEKSRGLACDAVILDLEDAVAPAAKVAARAAAVAAVREGGWGERALVVRINGIGTSWFDDDVATLQGAAVTAILVPKLDGPADLALVHRALGEGVPLWAMIESCRGVLALGAIAAAAEAHRLTALVAGTNDLAKDMRCQPGTDRQPLIPALAAVVMAARSAGIAAIDGVCNALDDPDLLAVEAEQGARLGFDGKSLIHPSQIDAANRAFAPSADAVAQARAVIAAFADPANAGKGAIRLGADMVERLHLADAERIISLADGARGR